MNRIFHLKLIVLLILTITLGYALGAHLLRSEQTSADADFPVALPIIMYHSILNDSSQWGKFVLSPAQLEEDLDYLIKNGYAAVTVADLIAYVDEGTPLPPKPVMITFDDGFYNNYLYAYPLLKQRGLKAVISPIAKFSDLYTESGETSAYYSHIKWNEAAEMVQSGVIELQNHSYDMHTNQGARKGSHRMKGESVEAYQSLLFSDMKKAHDAIHSHTGVAPTAYTYPFGDISKEASEVIARMGYRASLSCQEGINRITRDANCLFFLKRYNRPSGKSSADYFAPILQLAK